jgi:hypothetical protein
MNEKTYLQIITGNSGGGRLITGTTAVTGEWDAIVVNESCVIDAIEINDVDVTTARGYNSNTLVAGMFIGAGFNYTGQNKWRITSIKLTSGSVMAY